MQIWKFPLEIAEKQTVQIPKTRFLLHFEVVTAFSRPGPTENLVRGSTMSQTPTFWAMVDENAEKAPLEVRMVGTGWPVPRLGSFIGTALVGSYVWHFFTTENAVLERANRDNFAYISAPDFER